MFGVVSKIDKIVPIKLNPKREGGFAMRGKTIKEVLSASAPFETRFIPDLEELEAVTRNLQQSGYKVVLTQGVYDLIHEGHGRYLELAKQQGDILIVGVDTDELTRKRKGKNRPVVPESERLRMLAFLRSVDILTLRTLEEAERDIDYLHKVIRPDVLVMSHTTRDFPVSKRAEIEKVVGEVVIFEPQAETSTSARIRDLTIDGAGELKKRLIETMDGYFSEVKGVK